MIFICEDLPGAKTLLNKLSINNDEHAVIPLTTDEMNVMENSHIIGLKSQNKQIEILEVDQLKQYIAIVNNNVEIEDIISVINHLKIDIGIIRVDNND